MNEAYRLPASHAHYQAPALVRRKPYSDVTNWTEIDDYVKVKVSQSSSNVIVVGRNTSTVILCLELNGITSCSRFVSWAECHMQSVFTSLLSCGQGGTMASLYTWLLGPTDHERQTFGGKLVLRRINERRSSFKCPAGQILLTVLMQEEAHDMSELQKQR